MDESCLKVPTISPTESLYVVWPGDNEDDCICPLSNDGHCIILTNCECYSSSFAPGLRLTGASTSDKGSVYNLCWSNFLAKHNNSNVYFFYESTECIDANDPEILMSKTFVNTSIL